MDVILERMKQHKKQNLPYVVYRKPNSKTIVGIFQQNDHVYFTTELEDKGFVFAPFDGEGMVLFPFEFSEIGFGTFTVKPVNQSSYQDSVINVKEKEKFTTLVKKGVQGIWKGDLKKVVLSRTETISFENFKTKKTFEKMLLQYPTAFCYCWFHPKVGLWMGATPEKLLQAKNKQFATVALAGTQTFQDMEEIIWGDKEIEEQEFVTNFIMEKLEKVTDELSVSSPYSIQAGNLLHLKTDIEGVLRANASLKEIVSILHPTPAVCGLPKESAKDFILQNEAYEREFYTGFLGELNYDFSKNEAATDLYVNLRCMKIKEYEAQLFVGCGVTKESNPEAEWEETANKSLTMKSIIL
jgi:isochorismate synthase